jgi:hypothetical protein
MRSTEAIAEIEEIQISAAAGTGAWRENDRFCPLDWNIQILTNRKTRLGSMKLQKRRGGKILNLSTDGMAYRMHKSIEAAPGDRVLVQLDKCAKGYELVQYNAVIEVVRICEGPIICARFVHAPWDLINAIEASLE